MHRENSARTSVRRMQPVADYDVTAQRRIATHLRRADRDRDRDRSLDRSRTTGIGVGWSDGERFVVAFSKIGGDLPRDGATEKERGKQRMERDLSAGVTNRRAALIGLN